MTPNSFKYHSGMIFEAYYGPNASSPKNIFYFDMFNKFLLLVKVNKWSGT